MNDLCTGRPALSGRPSPDRGRGGRATGGRAAAWALLCLLAAAGPGSAAHAADAGTGPARGGPRTLALMVECDGQSVCREADTGLPFRVLPRSFAHVYRERLAREQDIVRSNVRAFRPLYVFARDDLDLSDPAAPRGWYRVGETRSGPPLGWMQAEDVLEWRQALILAYTHPGVGGEGRSPVLMFRRLEDLEALVQAPDRVAAALGLYEAVARGEAPDGVVSKEPERFVHITEDFYILPIVDHELAELGGDEVRLLRLAAAVPGSRAAPDDPDLLENPRYRREALTPPASGAAAALGVDLVFVMDLTLSMQPYIDRTKEAVSAIARRLSEEGVESSLRLGLVGFRDDVAKAPELEFTARNFTPELVDLPTFVRILDGEARAATRSSPGYAEEVFAGVDLGLASRWRPGSLRFICLVGDASSHPEGHPQSTTGKNAFVLRQAAEDGEVHVIAIQLLNPAHPQDQPLARDQFGTLAQVRGAAGETALVQVDTRDQVDFRDAVQRVSERMADVIAAARAGELTAAAEDLPPQPAGDDAVAQADRAAQAVIRAALVEYLGREAEPPKDILVWAADRDLLNPAVHSLEVRVLVTREQLSSLVQALDQVLTALSRSAVTQGQFFTALQEVAGQTLKRPDAIREATTLGETGLLPSFILSLPYHSEVLALNDEIYASMTADQRAALLSGLRAKLRQYRTINEQVDAWVRLDEEDPESDRVYPLHLDYLP